jgi:outer membrane protein
MKRFWVIFILPLLLVLSFNSYGATIGIIDMEKIFSTAPQVKKINDDLKTEFADKKNHLTTMSQALRTDMQSYQKNKSVMSKSSLTALEQKITQEQQQLQQSGIAFQKEVYTAQSTKTKDFLTHVKDIVKSIAEKKNLDLVMPKAALLYSVDSLDITPDVLKALQ